MRATVLALLLCAGCGHVSNQAATAMTFAAAAAFAQLVAPPALEGRTGICSEYRELRCVTAALCAHSESLGCDVCRCESLFPSLLPVFPGSAFNALPLSSPWALPPR